MTSFSAEGSCVLNADCDELAAPTCTLGTCGPCTNDGDCQNDDNGEQIDACHESTGECVECRNDSHCNDNGGNDLCATTSSTCGECNTDEDCVNPTPSCDTTTEPNACVGCDATHPCAGNLLCAGGSCVECVDSGDCMEPAEPICLAGSCKPCTADPPATGDAECQNDDPPQQACFAGQCVGCTTDGHCPDVNPDDDEACSAKTNTCVECTESVHCEDGNSGGATCDGFTHSCVACLVSTDCTIPVKPICDGDPPFCRGCSAEAGDDECADRDETYPVCDVANGACVQCLFCDDFELGDACAWSLVPPEVCGN